MVKFTPKRPWIRVIGITLVFFGIYYLKEIGPELKTSSISFLTYVPQILPTSGRIVSYWICFALLLYTWDSYRRSAIIIRRLTRTHFIGLIGSWCVMVWYAGVPLDGIIQFLFLKEKYSTGTNFWGWISYIAIACGSLVLIHQIQLYLYPEAPRDEVLVRGKRFLTLDRAREISNAKVATDGPGVKFGWLTVPESQATTHFAVVGATGSGKTLLIRNLMESVFPRIKKGSDSRALVYDPKRDMLPILKGLKLDCEIVTLHPFDKRGAAWDMAKDILSPASADQMATILIPADKNSSSPFFTDAARALMTGAITVFIKKCPEEWTFRDLILTLKNAERLKSVLLTCEETKDLVEQYFSNERTANDVISTIATKIQRYQYIAATWDKAEKKISLKDWANGEFVLVLGNDEETRSAVDALNQVIFKRISELLLNQSESFTRRSWIVLDELREAGLLPGLSSLLSKGRSKGVAIVLGFQDIEGLAASMRDNRLANEVVGLCANKAILRLDSAETARWASSQFGEQEVEQRKITSSDGKSSNDYKMGGSTSSSTSESWVNLKKQAVMPVEFLDLPPVEKSAALYGYYIIPSVGSFHAKIRMSGEDSILGSLLPADPETPGFIERDKADQDLRPWSEEDIKRLNLSLGLSRSVEIQMQESPHEGDVQSYQNAHNDPLEMVKRS